MKFSKPRDTSRDHLDWLALVDVSGPFLSLPVLRKTWPSLDGLTKSERERLRAAHSAWQHTGDAGPWIDHILRDLLGWGDALHTDGLDAYKVDVPEHDTTLVPGFVLVEPGKDVTPANTRLIGLISDGDPARRVKGSEWSATPADRVAHLCRAHDVPLGLATDGRRWALVWAPRQGVTTTAVFDSVSWNEAADLIVVRAFVSLLRRDRFFAVTADETLPALLEASKDNQELVTERLGAQVRQAVELLVAAIGRAEAADRDRGGPGLPKDVTPHDVYRAAVSVMMRIVFLLFAEERNLLPADNDLYLRAYSASRLCEELEARANASTETELENTYAAWHRLLALFTAVYKGVDHPRLKMHAHDGSLFDPDQHAWLPLSVDDRTVLHMLRAVQYVWMSAGKQRTNRSLNVPDFENRDKAKKGERRKLSFRSLDVEQIGYVYEGLLAFEGLRAVETVVGLVGTEGLEEEVPLRDLEWLAEQPDLAATLAEKYKDSGIGSVATLQKALAPMDPIETEKARSRLLAVTKGDGGLAERLLPFYGVIRADLRGQPMVILPGALYVTESVLRKNTGTHYTPRELAEEVAVGTLEPLVYKVGPLQTADRSKWVSRSSKEILGLKIADIAMGSAAFLVAAARYLGDRLVEAWSREGDEAATVYLSNLSARASDADEDPVVIEARRQVIEHCLYGVDINPMAVEMAKLSLWLISMDPNRPFTFLDDRLVAGDSLLGIVSIEQLEFMHLDPKRGRQLYKDAAVDLIGDIRSLLSQVAERRRALVAIASGDDPLAALARKRSILGQIELETAQARSFADLLVGASLAHATDQGRIGNGHPVPGPLERAKARGFDSASLKASVLAGAVARQEPGSMLKEREQRKEWLATDHILKSFDRLPVHWPLVFPEVFDEDKKKRPNGRGFDAVIGNPPFLHGSRISGTLGPAYREFIVSVEAEGVRGNADLVTYFVLRAHDLIHEAGQVGVIATNSLAQTDSREVGLDRLVEKGVEIRRAVKSRPWPSNGAALEYCAIWTSREVPAKDSERILDGRPVSGITSSLTEAVFLGEAPKKLKANKSLASQGVKIDGIGFTLEPEVALDLIQRDRRNSEVLFPFLNGHEVNSDPVQKASRWVINFHDWPEDRARTYPECYEQVRRLVKPERDKLRAKLDRENWWLYTRRRPDLVRALREREEVIVLTLHASTVMPVLIPTGPVFSHALGVFPTGDTAFLSLLSSSPHFWWTVFRGSSLKADIRYTLSDVFETFPLAPLDDEMRELGARLHTFRRGVMLARNEGITGVYNLVNNPRIGDSDIVELRRIHAAIDESVCRAYGWNDLIDILDHGHYPVGRDLRFTVAPGVQREFVNRLLKLNHARYEEEVAKGLHDKPGKKVARPKGKAKPAAPDPQGGLW